MSPRDHSNLSFVIESDKQIFAEELTDGIATRVL